MKCINYKSRCRVRSHRYENAMVIGPVTKSEGENSSIDRSDNVLSLYLSEVGMQDDESASLGMKGCVIAYVCSRVTSNTWLVCGEVEEANKVISYTSCDVMRFSAMSESALNDEVAIDEKIGNEKIREEMSVVGRLRKSHGGATIARAYGYKAAVVIRAQCLAWSVVKGIGALVNVCRVL